MIFDQLHEIQFELDCETTGIHQHTALEILFVLSGRVAVMTENRNFVMEREALVIFNSFQFHEIYRDGGSHVLSVYIPLNVLHHARIDKVKLCSTLQPELGELVPIICSKIAEIFYHYNLDAEKKRLYILSDLYDILGILKEKCSVNVAIDDQSNGAKYQQRNQEILTYIYDHFQEKLTMEEVAGHFFLSSSYFSRYFRQQTGMNFSEYIKKMRISRAVRELCDTNESVTQIALESGFGSSNAMIDAFKQEYHMTPGQYRKRQISESQKRNENNGRQEVPFAALMHYRNKEKYREILNQQVEPAFFIDVNTDVRGEKVRLCHRELINAGWAKDLLLEIVRNSIRKAQKEIGFHYIRFHGLLDDSMELYKVHADGIAEYNYAMIDIVFDFILSVGLKPWLELGGIPSGMIHKETAYRFRDSILQLPDSLEQWRNLIRGVIAHLLKRYGREELAQWKFMPFQGCYTYYNLFTLDEYCAFYEVTYKAVREILPDAVMCGPGFDADILYLSQCHDLEYFICFCRDRECMPDLFCFQCFHGDYTNASSLAIEQKLVIQTEIQSEPVPVTEDTDYLSEVLDRLHNCIRKEKVESYQLAIDVWDSTIWQRDLGNDTCFKSAFLVKNVLENEGKTCALGYGILNDYTDQFMFEKGLYHGGTGMMNYLEIPKASYNAYYLLNDLKGEVIAKGDGYYITRVEESYQIQIMIYYYCHYNKLARDGYQLSENKSFTVDRYQSFVGETNRNFLFRISGMAEGTYTMESRIINRETGSSYDIWEKMGAPEELSREQLNYLLKSSEPGYIYSKYQIEKDIPFEMSVTLQPHEVRLISIKKVKEDLECS